MANFNVFLVAFAPITLIAANCPAGGVTVFFGNGILTNRVAAYSALTDLQKRVDSSLDAVQPQRDRSCVQYSLAYDSRFIDSNGIIATGGNFLAQIADAAVQAGLSDYSAVWSQLFEYSPTFASLPDGWDQALGQLFSNALVSTAAPLQSDLRVHIQNYQSELNNGNSIITVAHSQGNLYVNEAFTVVSVPAAQQFEVIAVATPGDHVPGGGPWFTLENDIITIVPFALKANAANSNTPDRCLSAVNLASRTRCHDFEKSYLIGDDTGPRIIGAVGIAGQRALYPGSTGRLLLDLTNNAAYGMELKSATFGNSVWYLDGSSTPIAGTHGVGNFFGETQSNMGSQPPNTYINGLVTYLARSTGSYLDTQVTVMCNMSAGIGFYDPASLVANEKVFISSLPTSFTQVNWTFPNYELDLNSAFPTSCELVQVGNPGYEPYGIRMPVGNLSLLTNGGVGNSYTLDNTLAPAVAFYSGPPPAVK